MARVPPAVARVRLAVRRQLSDLAGGTLLLVACSGGPDSMALASQTAFLAPRMGLRCGLVTVDHGLQEGSADRAARVAAWARGQGLDPVVSFAVAVDSRQGGPEAAARDARYRELSRARQQENAVAVLLGHTMDDQAETVLLALARGSGPRGIAGMPARRRGYWRPLLDVCRADTVQTCRDLDLPSWNDPHNTDPAYLRSRLRTALPVLTETLGERLVANLARTAQLVADDLDALDTDAAALLAAAGHDADHPAVSVAVLGSAHRAVRTRALRSWVLEAGVPGDNLGHVHIEALDALITGWHGQGPVALPGGFRAFRDGERLRLDQPR